MNLNTRLIKNVTKCKFTTVSGILFSKIFFRTVSITICSCLRVERFFIFVKSISLPISSPSNITPHIFPTCLTYVVSAITLPYFSSAIPDALSLDNLLASIIFNINLSPILLLSNVSSSRRMFADN